MKMDKFDFGSGVQAMRTVAGLLLTWAEDLEKSGSLPGTVSVPPGQGEDPAETDRIAAEDAGEVSGEETTVNPESAEAADLAPDPEPPAPPTFRRVLFVLTQLCGAGLSPQVQGLINSFGGQKLSDLAPALYGALEAAGLQMAENASISIREGEGDE